MSNRRLVIWLLIICSSITIYLFTSSWLDGYRIWGSQEVKYDVTGQIGDFIGGVVGTIISAAGFYFLYLTLRDQRLASEEQRKAFERERFESRFFDLLKIHRDNVSQMNIQKLVEYKTASGSTVRIDNIQGYQVAKNICDDIYCCKDEVNPFFERKELKDIYKPEYLEALKTESSIIERQISLKELAKYDLIYCIVFFGLDANGVYILKKNLDEKYLKKFYEPILNYLYLKPVEHSEYWIRWRKLKRSKNPARKLFIASLIIKKRKGNTDIPEVNFDLDSFYYSEKYEKFYTGYQLQLSHYFRHLFQTVNFVNNQRFISYEIKYDYIKTLRAQLTTYEQVLFYLNSLSSLGDIWELRISKRFHSDFKEIDTISLVNSQLITKYNLIKNLPSGQLFKQEFEKFYPLIDYEFISKNPARLEVEKFYN